MKSLSLLLLLTYTTLKISATTVYLCDSKSAKKYHLDAKCRGLSNCSYKIIKTTVDQAKKQGKTMCKWEE